MLVVDRGEAGADTLSTHALMKGGVVQLDRWGLLPHVVDAGTPPILQTTFHYGPETVTVPTKPVGGVTALYAPRRTVLDPILVDGARAAGADVQFGTSVTSLLRDEHGRVIGIEGTAADGAPMVATARVVIGADGIRSRVARDVAAVEYLSATSTSAFVYAYFVGLDVDGYEWFYRPAVAAGVIPTNGGALVWAGGAAERIAASAREGEQRFWLPLREAAPEIVEQVAAAERTSRWHGWPGHRGFHRQSWGPGWALVGDAAHFKDPISAHGLTDAMRDAELLARAVDDALRGRVRYDTALGRYQAARDALAFPLFKATDRIASYEWDLAEVRVLLLEVSQAMQAEVRAIAALDHVEVAA